MKLILATGLLLLSTSALAFQVNLKIKAAPEFKIIGVSVQYKTGTDYCDWTDKDIHLKQSGEFWIAQENVPNSKGSLFCKSHVGSVWVTYALRSNLSVMQYLSFEKSADPSLYSGENVSLVCSKDVHHANECVLPSGQEIPFGLYYDGKTTQDFPVHYLEIL